jgi:redox-sensitive bicupin YhaK (pirin superfamily)
MKKIRSINFVQASHPTMEGAGVKLKRAFAHRETKILDPFLLLDDFHSDNPNDYIAGFPWHPHRGIETVTYMINGIVKHEDSLGNAGTISGGDIQWMTAGNGIVHQEMPQLTKGLLAGFQLWVNLPSSHKMISPRYQEILSNTVPEVKLATGGRVRVLAGEYEGIKGPVKEIIADPEYLDVELPSNQTIKHSIKSGYTAFAYIFEGSGYFHPNKENEEKKGKLVVYDRVGDYIEITASVNDSVRFLLVSGKAINEPIAWSGPIVMNTQEELRVAFEEYRNGTFIKHK